MQFLLAFSVTVFIYGKMARNRQVGFVRRGGGAVGSVRRRNYLTPRNFRIASQVIQAGMRAYQYSKPYVNKVISKVGQKRRRVSNGASRKKFGHYAGGPTQVVPKKKLRRPRPSKALTKGFEIGAEYRGVTSDQDMCGVMVGTPLWRYCVVMWASAYRELLKAGGHCMDDWEAVPKFSSTTFRIKYRLNMTSVDTANIDVAQAATHINTVYDILAAIFAVTGSSREMVFVEFIAFPNAGTVQRTIDASIMLNDYKCTVYDRHVLMIQNRTAGSTADDTSAEDITNNPLTFRTWKLRGTGARGRVENFATSVSESVNISPVSGYTFGPLIGGGSVKKIAAPTAFYNTTGTVRGTLMPGSIKKCNFSNKQTLWFNKLWFQIGSYISDASTAITDSRSYSRLGFSQLYQFEKLCQVQADVSSLDVVIGFEHNLICGGYLTRARVGMVRRLEEVN